MLLFINNDILVLEYILVNIYIIDTGKIGQVLHVFSLIIFSSFANPDFLSHLLDIDIMILIMLTILSINSHKCFITFL